VDRTVAELLVAVGARVRTAERRVAGSLVVLGYSARLVGATLAVLLGDGLLLDVTPPRVRTAYRPESGFALSLPEPRGRPVARPEWGPAWSAAVVEANLAGFVAEVAHTAPVAAALLWGNVASGVVGTLRALAGAGVTTVDNAAELAATLLGSGRLTGSGHLTVHNGRMRFRRRSCCLYYRLDGGGLCGDCALAR
jgi:hypothetical protein